MNVLVTTTVDPAVETPEPFSVSTSVSLQERRYRTIKNGDMFGVFDHGGDILSGLGGTDGLYHQDTRHLSRFDLALAGRRPLLLSSALGMDNVMLTSDLSNSSALDLGANGLDQGVIHVQRSLFLGEKMCHGRLAVCNFAFAQHRVQLELRFEADFADLFEVRGMHREQRGRQLPAVLADDGGYAVLPGPGRGRPCHAPGVRACPAADHRQQRTVRSAPRPARPGDDLLQRGLRAGRGAPRTVPARRSWTPTSASSAACAPARPVPPRFRPATKSSTRACAARPTTCVCSSPRSRPAPIPMPAFPGSAPRLGRDALITALLMLAVDPTLASGVLRYLAQEQATSFDPASEAEPGKILHEMRGGEMAALREVPFRRYYGSVDSTPLFVMLAGRLPGPHRGPCHRPGAVAAD